MTRSETFRELLTKAIYRISACESGKPIGVIQDELGYALQKRGGSAIDYWRQGNLPKSSDVEKLAREIVKRSDLGVVWLQQFLESANFPYPQGMCQELFPESGNAIPSTSVTSSAAKSGVMLPMRLYRTLVGRQALVDELITVLRDPDSRWSVGIDGIGGVGKTALALEVVVQCKKRQLFEVIVWFSLNTDSMQSVANNVPTSNRQNGDSLFEVVLNAVATQIDEGNIAHLAEHEKAKWVHALLQRQRTLLVLDDLQVAGSAQDQLVARLHSLLNPSKVLLVSRRRFVPDVYAIRLNGLDTASARLFVEQEAADRHVARIEVAHPEEINAIIDVTGGSPLAMKLIVGQLHHLPIHVILEHLQQVKPISGDANDEYTQLYHSIYTPLTSMIKDSSKRLLVTMALFFPGLSVSISIISTISSLSKDELFPALDELWRYSLIEVEGATIGGLTDTEYYLHSLTHYFVVAYLISSSDELGSYFTATIKAAMVYLLDQLTAHIQKLLPRSLRLLVIQVLTYALPHSLLWPTTKRLLVAAAPQMEQAGHRHDWILVLKQGVDQSHIQQDATTGADLQLHLGILYQLLGQYDVAAAYYEAATADFQSGGDKHKQAIATIRKAQLRRLQRHYDDARQLLEVAFALIPENDVDRALGHTVQGEIAIDNEQWQSAADNFTRALHLWKMIENQRRIAWSLTNLGIALRALGNEEEALHCYEEAIATLGFDEDPVHWATTNMNMGNVFLGQENPREALRLYTMAEPIFERTQDLLRLALIASNRGFAYRQLAQWQQAETVYLASIKLYQQIEHLELKANALDGLGLVYLGVGDYEQAIQVFKETVTLLRQLEGEPGWAYLNEEVHRHLQDATAALRL